MIDKPNASLLRRLGAMIYDSILILALWMVSSLIIVATITDGEAPSGLGFQFFLYFEMAVFYIYFWQATGQTLGMQTWRIQLVDDSGDRLPTTECILRFAVATLSVLALGLGFVWMLFNRDRLTLHDVVSKSRVIHLGKPSPAAE